MKIKLSFFSVNNIKFIVCGPSEKKGTFANIFSDHKTQKSLLLSQTILISYWNKISFFILRKFFNR